MRVFKIWPGFFRKPRMCPSCPRVLPSRPFVKALASTPSVKGEKCRLSASLLPRGAAGRRVGKEPSPPGWRRREEGWGGVVPSPRWRSLEEGRGGGPNSCPVVEAGGTSGRSRSLPGGRGGGEGRRGGSERPYKRIFEGVLGRSVGYMRTKVCRGVFNLPKRSGTASDP